MNCKRIICIMLCVCMLVCLTACYKNTQNPQESESKVTDNTVQTTEGKVTQESMNTTKAEETQPVDDSDNHGMLSLEKSLHALFEWEDGYDKALVKSKFSDVTLGQDDADKYPEMALVLSQLATMQKNAMEDEFDNFVVFAHEELLENEDGFEPYVSTIDVQVRRADSVVISLLTYSCSDYSGIENYRVFHGTNYDTETGRELKLDDVIKNVNNDLAIAVEDELTSHMWTGEFYSEYAVQEYFADTPYHGFNWTMDYNGVTFYFEPGLLCDEGAMTATLSFAEHPELFYEKYMVVPEEYIVELPLDFSFFTELDSDAYLEEISVSGWWDDERDRFVDYSVHTETSHYIEECFAYDLHPYYVKTLDGNYVYLFCEDINEGARQMNLIVLCLNEDGSVAKLANKNLSPSWLLDNKFIVPADPSNLILDDTDSDTQKVIFTVDGNGLPKAK